MERVEKRKYVKHIESQQTVILDRAERLFVDRGVENVTFSDIAAAAGVTRATLYRYYENKQRVLWGVYNRQMESFGQNVAPELEHFSGTTYERLSFYMHMLTRSYADAPETYRFMDVFFQTYQEATTEEGRPTYREMHGDGFGTGDTVRLLSADFHDGSVRPELDPVPTVTALVYGVMSMLFYLPKCAQGLSVKYGVTDQLVLNTCVDAMLAAIRA